MSRHRWRGALAAWWEALRRPDVAGRWILGRSPGGGIAWVLAAMLLAPTGLYGLAMGCYRGAIPSLVSGAKLPFLFLLTIAVCVPPFYAANCLWGPRLTARECVRMLLLAASASSVAIGVFAPFCFIFSLPWFRSSYTFLILMHLVLFGVAGSISVIEIARIFRAAAAELGRRFEPPLFLYWAALYGLVGTQMAWALRPWVGSRSLPYAALRPIESSFIAAVWRLLSG